MARKSNNSVKAIETLTPSTFVANDPIVQVAQTAVLTEADEQIANILENLEKIGEQQTAAINAEIAELDAKLAESEEIRNSNLKPYYMTVQMNIEEAQVLTPRAVLMNQQVSTTEAIAFTDNIKSVRSIIRKMNKKGERQYTAILKEATLYVWRTL